MSDRYIEWIREGLSKPGKTQSGIAKALGIAHPQISLLLKGRRRLKVDEIPKIAAYLEMPAPDFDHELSRVPFDHDDPSWHPSSDLPPANGLALANGGFAYHPNVAGALPEIDVANGAGEGQVGEIVALQIGDEVVSGHRVLNEWLFPDGYLRNEVRASPNFTLVMSIVGDSMSPNYHPGDRVLVDTSQNELRADGVYVISDGFAPPQIKRLMRVLFTDPVMVRIISDNPSFPMDTVELSRVRIIGRVVGHVARK